jgi:M3 family oligoendopeptidase
MKRHFFKHLSFLLAVILISGCLSLTGCINIHWDPQETALIPIRESSPQEPAGAASSGEDTAAGAYFKTPWHADINYGDMEYKRYDSGIFNSAKSDFLSAIESGTETFSEIEEKYGALYKEVLYAATMCYLAEIRFYEDTLDQTWADEYNYSNDIYLDISNQACAAVSKALQSGYAGDLKAYLGEETAQAFLSYEEMSDREIELLERENELSTQYEQLICQDVSVSVDNAKWTFSDLEDRMHSLSEDDYYKICFALEAEQNAQVGGIFLELVDIRTELAHMYGYDSFADYAYDYVYNRDYTTADAGAFCDAVKNSLAPAYFSTIAYSDAMYYEFGGNTDFQTEKLLSILKEYGGRISPELSAAADYLSEYSLYSIGPSSEKADTGYVATLPYYQEPFLFNKTYGTPEDVCDTVHEFGHFVDAYYNQENNFLVDLCSYDISEVHSQGLECLFDAYYDEIFSEEEALPARIQHLDGLLSSIIMGCIEDEFQQAVYANPDMTLEEINRTYYDIYLSYGLDYEGDRGMDYEWMYVNHTFTAPMYYISYATSALTALDIWGEAQKSHTVAADKYLNFMSYGAYNYGYIELLDRCGFGNFTQAGYVGNVTDPVIDELHFLINEYSMQDTALQAS